MIALSHAILKIVLSAGMVIAITLTAERVSSRLAGVMVGFPLGAGLMLFFLGLEQGPAFAAQSALWSLEGILATLVFCWCYRLGAGSISEKRGLSLAAGCITGLAGYFAAAVVLRVAMPHNTALRLVLVVFLLIPPAIAFRKASTGTILNRVTVSRAMLLVRAGFAALVVLTVTGCAAVVGPVWSGLLATFPTVILPSVMILHFHYGSDSVPGFFRDTPLAMPAIIVFALAVHWSLPRLGVIDGILLSYAAAVVYLCVYELGLRSLIDRLLVRWE